MDAATALLGATLAEWQRKREEEEARRAAEYKERLANGRGSYREAAINYQRSLDNFRATLNDAVNKGMSSAEADQLKANVINSGKIGASLGAAQGYIAKKEKEADTQADWIEKQEAANAAILQEALAAQKAEEEARRAGLAAYYESREEEKSSWWQGAWSDVLQPIANFVTGVVYQGVVRNNVDSLTIAGVALFAPEKSSTLENYFQSWEGFEENSAISDTFSFQAGKVVGGLLGIAQGIWEIGSGIATGTGGTLISCGTGILCLGGGGASLALGGAMVAHGAIVLGTSAVETGLEMRSLLAKARPQGKIKAEQETYEDALKEGIVGESEHVDDGESGLYDFVDKSTRKPWEAKNTVPTFFRSAVKQAHDIASHIKTTPSDVLTVVNLKGLTAAEKETFIAEFYKLGVDMSKVKFVNR